MLPERHDDLVKAKRQDILRQLEQDYLARQARAEATTITRTDILERIAHWFEQRTLPNQVREAAQPVTGKLATDSGIFRIG